MYINSNILGFSIKAIMWTLGLILPFTLAAASANFYPQPCFSGYTRFGTKCIRFVSTPKTFQEAQADCQHTGGKLFEPQSKLDQDLVLFNPNAASVNFIGIVKQGSNFVYASTHGSLTITPDFMPNHPVGGRNCLLAFVPPTRIYSHRTWIDADCAGRQPYICEQKNSANCAFENTLFVGEFGPSQPHGVCSIKCKYDAECKFFIIRASDGACALRNFTPSTTRLPVPGLSSGLKGDSAASGLLVAKVMPAYYPLQCQNLCQADDQCQSAIFDARASLCTFNYATLDKKLPLPAQSYVFSIPKHC